MGIGWTILWYWLIAANVFAFALCGLDKQKARRHQWRIPERMLLLASALGGAYGFYAGMLCFRHKTRHLRFQILVPLFGLLWAAGLIAAALLL